MEPEHNSEYANASYWEQRFQKEEQYDWLGTLKDFKEMLFERHPQLLERKDKPMLILGCGNSTLSHELNQLSFTDITSIDYSPTVIDRMRTKYVDVKGLKWEMADMRDMAMFQDQSFDFIL